MGGYFIDVPIRAVDATETPRALWEAIWSCVWAGVRELIYDSPAAQRLYEAFHDDLLPDHEDRVVRATEDSLGFMFPGFGGLLEATASVMCAWFRLMLHEALGSIEAILADGGYETPLTSVDFAALRERITAEAPTLVELRGLLWLPSRGLDGELVLAFDERVLDDATPQELAHASAMLAAETTDDPVINHYLDNAPL